MIGSSSRRLRNGVMRSCAESFLTKSDGFRPQDWRQLNGKVHIVNRLRSVLVCARANAEPGEPSGWFEPQRSFLDLTYMA
jgi:hypothetical protein